MIRTIYMQIGYNNDGRIKALEIRYYSNAGNTLDLSESVMEKAVMQSDNSYEYEIQIWF